MGNILQALHKSKLDRMLPGMIMGGLSGAAGGAYLGGGETTTYSPLGVPEINSGHRAEGALTGAIIGTLLGAVPGHFKHTAVSAFDKGLAGRARAAGRALGKRSYTRNALRTAVQDAEAARVPDGRFFHKKFRAGELHYKNTVNRRDIEERAAQNIRDSVRSS